MSPFLGGRKPCPHWGKRKLQRGLSKSGQSKWVPNLTESQVRSWSQGSEGEPPAEVTLKGRLAKSICWQGSSGVHNPSKYWLCIWDRELDPFSHQGAVTAWSPAILGPKGHCWKPRMGSTESSWSPLWSHRLENTLPTCWCYYLAGYYFLPRLWALESRLGIVPFSSRERCVGG